MDERVINWDQFYASNQTVISPTALAFTLVCAAALFIVDRRRALLPLLMISCFIPMAQRIVIAGLDFNMMRLAILAGWARVLTRGEHVGLEWRPLDTAFVAWLVAGSVVQIAREGEFGTVVWRAGFSFEAAGTYLLFRCLLRTPRDLMESLRYFAYIVIPFAAFMSVEYSTGHNPFAVFGGVPDVTIVREDRLRCQGAFGHPILAGDFGAGLAPLFIGTLLSGRMSFPLAVAASVGSVLIVMYSGSSGPILALIGGVGGWLLWPLRYQMYLVRWAFVAAAGMLQLVMNHPIWFIFVVLTVIGGSTGWYRYALIDAFIRNVGEWAVLGTNSTAHWGWGLQDVTNNFVLEGVHGGLVTFVLFVTLYVMSFKTIGRQMRRVARRTDLSPRERRSAQYVLWSLGSALFGHAMAMTAVSYTDQMAIVWYTLLGTIGSAEVVFAPSRARAPVPAAAPAPARA